MQDLDNTDDRELTQSESELVAEEAAQEPQNVAEKLRAAAEKDRLAKEGRKKRDDALNNNSKHGHGGEGEKEDSEGEKAEGKSEGGSHSQGQNIQNSQATIQFSSGGGVASLGNLIGLYASSASLVRAEGGGILNMSSKLTTTPRTTEQVTVVQKEDLIRDQGTIIQENTGSSVFNVANEGIRSLDIGSSSLNQFSTALKDVVLTSLDISAHADEGIASESPLSVNPFAPIVTSAPFIYVPPFNGISVLSNPTLIFALNNSPTSSQSILASNQATISTYFIGANLTPSSTYTYQVLTPSTTSGSVVDLSSSPLTGITINSVENTSGGSNPTNINVAAATSLPPSLTDYGITLSSSGSIYVNVLEPISVVLDIIGTASSKPLIVRIDAGPGTLVQNDLYQEYDNAAYAPYFSFSSSTGFVQPLWYIDPNIIVGGIGSNDQFTSLGSIFNTASTTDTIIGNAQGITVGNGAVSYVTGMIVDPNTGDIVGNATTSFNIPLSGSVYTYDFPSSVIYRQVGDSVAAADALPATYGNFSSFTNPYTGITSDTTLTLSPNVSYNLTFGNNVLDVWGQKFGSGDILDVNLSTSGGTSTSNTITMGGDTLGGYGTSFGSLQTLVIYAQSGDSASTILDTNFVFQGNELAVDVNNMGSILYPQLQTLDMELSPAVNGVSSAPSNVSITFEDSVVQGNTGSDTFYGDIQHLSNINSSTSYNGFLNPLNVAVTYNAAMEQVITVTTTDGNNNSITWANNTYIGGGQDFTSSGGSATTASDTYDFTLLDGAGLPLLNGNLLNPNISPTAPDPVMEGNATLTEFDPATDKLILELTPSLFKALDGAANGFHDKQITIADLNAGATFTNFTQMVDGKGVIGTTISFNGGGSLILDDINIPTDPNNPLYGFNDLGPNLTIEVIPSLNSAPISALSDDQIITTNLANLTSFVAGSSPFIYNVLTSGLPLPYYNELDNYFNNSTLATFTISGITPTVVTIDGVSDNVYAIGTGVTIDQFGTITVSSDASTPTLTALTITATDQNGNTATTTELFGFLDAPVTTVTNIESALIGTSNIITSDTANNVLTGEKPSATVTTLDIYSGATPPSETGVIDVSTSEVNTYIGSNLIVDTAGGTTAYGDYETINVTADGTGNQQMATSGTSTVGGAIEGGNFTFNANAFDITSGTVYGVTKNFDISIAGGSNDSVTVNTSNLTSATSVIDSGQFNSNHITIGDQTIYGSGTFYGNFETFNISLVAGTNGGFSFDGVLPSLTPKNNVDISAQVEDNVFTFDPVQITVLGDTTTNVFVNLQNLWITVEPEYSKVISMGDYTTTSSAKFEGNSFVFENATVTGGQGNTIFNADVNLNPETNATTGALTSPYAYTGFIDPVSVDGSSGNIVTKTMDNLGNSITWGNDLFVIGAGNNTFNFTLLDNAAGSYTNGVLGTNGVVTTSGTDTYAVFTGNDTISGFKVSTGTGTAADVITLNLEPNLYNQIVKAVDNNFGYVPTNVGTLLDFAGIATFAPSGNNTVITFLGGGTLTLEDVTVSNFTQLGSSLEVNELAAPAYVAPELEASPAAFDPVFINVSQPEAFANFINTSTTNPESLSYSYSVIGPVPPGVTMNPDGTIQGITLNPDGTLDVSVSGLVSVAISVTATDGTTTLTLPTVHIFALDTATSTVDYDSSVNPIDGVAASTAYEVTPATVYGGGGNNADQPASLTLTNSTPEYGSKLIDDTSTSQHFIYGVTQNINNDSATSLSNQNYNFDANLLNIYANGVQASTDQIFGDAQYFTLSTSTNAQVTGNAFTFGNNTIFGTGTLVGDVQNLNLTDTSASSAMIGNTFTFGENTIVAGAYENGTNVLTSSPGSTILIGNVEALAITGQDGNVDKITGNKFIFENDTLSANTTSTAETNTTTTFDGHLESFGNSDNPTAYGTSNFYDGVTVNQALLATGIVSIQDTSGNGNGNVITWGNDTYTGSTATGASNIYNFTIVGNTASTPQAVMQGFDAITNFNTSTDKLSLSLAYPVYAALAGSSSSLSLSELFSANGITVSQTADAAVLNFAGGGSIALDGYGTSSTYTVAEITQDLITNNSISVTIADPITAVANPTPPTHDVIILGATDPNNLITTYFNYGHEITVSVADGITETSTGVMNYNGNTGIVDTTVTSLSASDPYTTATANFGTSVQVLALDGTIINQAGNEQGSTSTDSYGTEAEVFIGQGNATITGGVTELDYNSSPSTTGSITYADKLIYDGSGQADTVYGDVQNIVMTNDGSTAGIANTSGQSITIGENYIEASGTIYANAESLTMTTSQSGAADPSGNKIVFGNDTIVVEGGTTAAPNEIYGHLESFGNSDNPTAYGTSNFYDGVMVNQALLATGIVSIQDTSGNGNGNIITWGNDTYTGSTATGASNIYNFTIVGNTASTPQAVMQGFDAITNFNTSTDKLSLSLAYPVYAALAGSSSPLSIAELFSTNGITVSQTADTASLNFAGGGSITLDSFGTNTYANDLDVENALANRITVNVADPITHVQSPTSPILVIGETIGTDQWTSIVNTSHDLSSTIALSSTDSNDGLTISSTGAVSYGSDATGIIDTTVNSITVSDITGTIITSDTSSSNPVQILALDAPVTDQTTGTEMGFTAAGVFIGHGNTIVGGGADVSYATTYDASNNSTLLNGVTETTVPTINVQYGEKLIYDSGIGTGSITGDVQNITLSATGTTDDVMTGSTSTSTTTISDEAWAGLNISAANVALLNALLTNSSVAANAQNISMSATGGTNIYSAGIITDTDNLSNVSFTSGINTITSSGTVYGLADNISLNATDGFYSGASGSSETTFVSDNAITTGGNTLTAGAGTSNILYGDAQSISMSVNSAANTATTTDGTTTYALNEASDFSGAVAKANATVTEGNSAIEQNTITFGGNTLVGGEGDSSLYASINTLSMINNEETLTNASQPTASEITQNHIIFGNTTETGTGGATEFYGDVNDLSQTNFYKYGVTVQDETVNGNTYVQVTDTAGSSGDSATIYGNTLQFGNDTMIASTASGATNTFNLDLLVTTDGNIVNEGKTTINNFGTPGPSNANMLNLQLSDALYNDIVTYATTNHITTITNGSGVTLITASLLDSYLSNNNGSVSVNASGNTVISFSDAKGDNLGSITLAGVTENSSDQAINSIASLGTNVEITADGVTTIDPASNPANTYNVTLTGDTMSANTQHVDVVDLSKYGQVIDFSGDIVINLPNSLYQAEGLSSSNTTAQNLQILENNANTALGGITVSEATVNNMTNTILTFTAANHGAVSTYGSIALHDTGPHSLENLASHLVITHH